LYNTGEGEMDNLSLFYFFVNMYFTEKRHTSRFSDTTSNINTVKQELTDLITTTTNTLKSNMEAAFANINTSIRGVFDSNTPYEMIPLINWDELARNVGKNNKNDITYIPDYQRTDMRVYNGNLKWTPNGNERKILLKQKWTEFDAIYFFVRYGNYLCGVIIPTWRLKFDLTTSNTWVVYNVTDALGFSLYSMSRDKSRWDDQRLSDEYAFYHEYINVEPIEYYGIRYAKPDISK